jgi:hypothetical protein
MAGDVRAVRDLDEFTEAFLAIGQYFSAEPKEERMKRFSESLPLDRMFAARGTCSGPCAPRSSGRAPSREQTRSSAQIGPPGCPEIF